MPPHNRGGAGERAPTSPNEFDLEVALQRKATVDFDIGFAEAFHLQGYLAREAGQAIGLGLGNHLINGTGSGQPRGLLFDVTARVTGPTGTATSFGTQGTVGKGTDLMLDLYASVAEPYLLASAAGWLLRSATLCTILKLKTTTAGELVGAGGTGFVGPPPAGSDASGSMVDKPVYIDPSMSAMAANAESVVYGDFSTVAG